MRNLYYVRTIGGVPVRLHYTWLIVALLGLVVLPGAVFPIYLPALSWLAGLPLAACALVLYAGAVAVHVLAQIVVTRLFGMRFPVLNLYPLGAVTRLVDRRGSPKAVFWIAVAGPVASFALWWALDWSATSGVVPTLWLAVLLYVTGQLSFYLGVLTLLPGLPLDGGRMLRALLWALSGSFESATRFARIAGQVIAYGLIVLGVSGLAADRDWVRAGAMVLVGWAIREAGGTAYRRALVARWLNRLTAHDFLRPPARAIAPDLPLRAFAATLRGRAGAHPTPVIADGMLLGAIDRRLLRDVPQGYWDTRTVGETMSPVANLPVLALDTPLSRIVPLLAHADSEDALFLPVAQDGRLVGIVDPDELGDLLDLEAEFALFRHEAAVPAPLASAPLSPGAGAAHSDGVRERAVGSKERRR